MSKSDKTYWVLTGILLVFVVTVLIEILSSFGKLQEAYVVDLSHLLGFIGIITIILNWHIRKPND